MGLRNMAFTGRAKIIKPNGEAPDDFGPQESPSGAEHYCCQGSRCRRRQKGHCYLHARSTDKSFQKIQTRLVRELEKKFSGKHVVFIAQRRILPKPTRKVNRQKQKRPR